MDLLIHGNIYIFILLIYTLQIHFNHVCDTYLPNTLTKQKLIPKVQSYAAKVSINANRFSVYFCSIRKLSSGIIKGRLVVGEVRDLVTGRIISSHSESNICTCDFALPLNSIALKVGRGYIPVHGSKLA